MKENVPGQLSRSDRLTCEDAICSNDAPSNLPVGIFKPLQDLTSYQVEPFLPVTEASDDKETTESDLNILNAHLAYSLAVLPNIRTLTGLCSLSNSVCKLIETRRKVKKLPFGESEKKAGRVFEVLE